MSFLKKIAHELGLTKKAKRHSKRKKETKRKKKEKRAASGRFKKC